MNANSIIIVLSCLGLAQAFFLILYLASLKKGNALANKLLAFTILGLTIRIGKSVLNTYTELEAWQRNLGIAAVLLVGPMLLLYGKSILKKQKRFSNKSFVHLIPFFLFAACCYFIPNRHDFISKVIYLLVFLHLAVYVVISANLLLNLKNQSIRPLFVWYRNLIIGVGSVCIFYIGHFFGLIPFYIGGAIFFSFLVYTFSFLLLKRHNFVLEKYQDSKLDSSSSKKVMSSIYNLFESENIFLDQTITLDKVAKSLETSSRNISRAINENSGINFSEFVNGYRIKKAKELLISKAYAKEKIATVAYDCGFGNVTSFNLAFKANTKQTPSEFRKQFSIK